MIPDSVDSGSKHQRRLSDIQLSARAEEDNMGTILLLQGQVKELEQTCANLLNIQEVSHQLEI